MEKSKTIGQRLSNIESLLLAQKTVLTFNEVAAYTGLSKSYLYKLTASGVIPCYKPQGKVIFFDKAEIDKWLLSNRSQTNDEAESRAITHVTLNKSKQ